MRRRDFITLVGGAAVAPAMLWPVAARAQQPAMPVVGFLNTTAPESYTRFAAQFRQGLSEAGFTEGQNVVVEYRWARNQYDQLPALAAELVRREVAVLVATGGEPATRAAQAATSKIPIVFIAQGDPVRAGFITSFNRPGGNMTGVGVFATVLIAKRQELLHELGSKLVAVLVNPTNPNTEFDVTEVQAAARTLGQQVRIFTASSEREIDAAFAALIEQRVDAVLVQAEPLFANRRDQIVALASRHAVPAIYPFREFVAAGGLISYGSVLADSYRQVGVYAGRILKGAKPADLPFMQPVKFELVVNLKIAKAIGIELPTSILLRADEVIE
jgi:putative ABC transport system substrate-binding protein